MSEETERAKFEAWAASAGCNTASHKSFDESVWTHQGINIRDAIDAAMKETP
jgi:hypothetical protein